jgi:iron complex outermembrane receptor protein
MLIRHVKGMTGLSCRDVLGRCAARVTLLHSSDAERKDEKTLIVFRERGCRRMLGAMHESAKPVILSAAKDLLLRGQQQILRCAQDDVVVAVLLLLAASSAGAQSRDTAVFRLTGVTVQATSPVATSGGASALEVHLDSMRLEPAPTLQNVLRDLPFVQVRTNPRGEGYFANRGSGFDAREVAVIIDGVPSSLNFDDRADLSVLPVTGTQTLTLVRGLPSLLYGPNVLGGVVELSSFSGASRGSNGNELNVGVDHTGARAASARIAVPLRTDRGTSFLRVGGGYRESDGFPLPRGVQEPAPFSSNDRRLNSDREQGDAFIASRYETNGGTWAAFSTFGYSGRRGTPAELSAASPHLLRCPLLQRSFSVVSLGSGERSSPFGGRGAVQLGVGYDFGRTKLDGFTSRTYTSVRNQEDDTDRNVNVRLVANQSIRGGGDVSGAFTYANVKRHEALTPGLVSDYRQRLWSGASELGWRIPSAGKLSALRATLGAAYDGSDTPETGGKAIVPQLTTWGGRTGVTALSCGGNLLMHAGMSRRVRFPALREMYSGTLANVEPNPELKPEALVVTEAGATARLGRSQVQAVAFHNDITNAIVRTTVNRKVKRVNRDRTTGNGLEVLASMPVGSASMSADITAQSIVSKDASTTVEYQAEYQPKFAGGVQVAAPLPFATRLNVATRAVGSQYCMAATSGYDRIAPSTRVNLGVSRAWGAFETTVGFDNVTDRAVYDQCGLPQPGRVVKLQVRVR